MQIVRVVDYSPAWPERYRRESAALAEVFGPELVAIHHIGSTSVQGLAAKPIIDMLAEVKTIGRVDVLDAGFMRLGYEPMGEFGIPGRRYFRKDSVVGGERQRTHQLHVFAHSDRENVVRHLAVPAYLRRHPEDAAAYAALKKAASQSRVQAVLTVEMSLGQMVDDVRLAVEGEKPVYFEGRAGGSIPTLTQIVDAAERALKGGK